MMSMLTSGSRGRRPATGGTSLSRSEMRLTIASTRRILRPCGRRALTAVTGGQEPANRAPSAAASARSLSTVLVPCAFT